jgi:hypothetical protein
MAHTDFQCVPLCDTHFLMDFQCGHGEVLSSWLNNHARVFQEERLCQVWVLSPKTDTEHVTGYFTLSSHIVRQEAIRKRDRTVDPNHGNQVAHAPHLPSTLLGKFALDSAEQGKGLAMLLMAGVYAVHLDIADQIGGKYLVVEVQEPRLESYYSNKFNFVPSTAPNDTLKSLYRPTATIETDLEPWLVG